VLKPDTDTFFVLPWSDPDVALPSAKANGQTVAGIICDVYTPDGTAPFEGDPRNILRRQIEKAGEMGFVYNTGPELEFFLFPRKQGKIGPFMGDSCGYFDAPPQDNQAVLNEVTYYLNHLGFNIEATHHEVAPSQYEIDPNYSEAMKTADRVLILKMALKTVAGMHGFYATFMPKPVFGVCGNGMHINQSLFNIDDDTNAFHDPEGKWELSETALHYLGGLLAHARENCAILASWVNSYKRLVVGYEAPVYMTWSHRNRTALIRIPAARGSATRLEQRNPDPAGNPYLQFAVLLASGLHGIEEQMGFPEPVESDLEKSPVTPSLLPQPFEKNVFELSEAERDSQGIQSLPSNLGEALGQLEKGGFISGILGPTFMTHFLKVKRTEYDEFRTQVTQWEIDKLLPIL
jgi:glutamine synthetase